LRPPRLTLDPLCTARVHGDLVATACQIRCAAACKRELASAATAPGTTTMSADRTSHTVLTAFRRGRQEGAAQARGRIRAPHDREDAAGARHQLLLEPPPAQYKSAVAP